MKEFLQDLALISQRTRAEIGNAMADLMIRHGRDPAEGGKVFLAAIDGIADLIQYGKLGPAAIDKLHNARKDLGISLDRENQR